MKNLFILSLLAAIFCGCIHLPTAIQTPAGHNVGTAPAVPHVDNSSTAKTEIQKTVNWFAVLWTLGGVACLVMAGFSGYAGAIIPAIKFALAGLLMPIFGIWFAFHWLLVVILTLIAAALFFLATHYGVVNPILQKIETEAANLASQIKAKI